MAWANLKTRQFRDFRATNFTRTVPWEYERPLPLHMIDNWSKIDRILLPNKAAMLFIGKRRRTAQKRRQKTPPKNAQNGVRTRFFAAQRTARSFETQLLRTCCHVAALLEKVANFSDTAATLSRKMTVALPRSSEAQNFRDFRDFRLYPHFQPGGVCATFLPTSPKVVQMLQNTETNPNVSGHGRILIRKRPKTPKKGFEPGFFDSGRIARARAVRAAHPRAAARPFRKF